jgi:hypothetical protein
MFFKKKFGKNHITLILDHEKSKLFSRAYVSNVAPLKIISFKFFFIDSGLCSSGKIETTAHYLLQCPNYIFIRNETMQTLGTIDVQSLIFGNSLKNENENRLVFETVLKYIARAKLFD